MEELHDVHELLHRQVHPNHLNEGRPTRIAFAPNSNDDGKLSVDRGSVTTAEASYLSYLERELLSAGTWSVTLSEVHKTSLRAFEDPLPDNPAHAVIDFGEFGKNRWKQASKALADFAIARGPSFQP